MLLGIYCSKIRRNEPFARECNLLKSSGEVQGASNLMQTRNTKSMCFIYIQYLQRHTVIEWLINVFVRWNMYNVA